MRTFLASSLFVLMCLTATPALAVPPAHGGQLVVADFCHNYNGGGRVSGSFNVRATERVDEPQFIDVALRTQVHGLTPNTTYVAGLASLTRDASGKVIGCAISWLQQPLETNHAGVGSVAGVLTQFSSTAHLQVVVSESRTTLSGAASNPFEMRLAL